MRHVPPPPRYRIYEHDRRLVVIDNWAEDPPEQQTMVPAPPTGTGVKPGRLDRIAFDGRTAFTTHRLYDAKGPRTIILDPASASTINGIKMALVVAAATLVFVAVVSPYLLLPLLALTQRKVRDRMRAATTAWIDRVGHAS